MHCRYMEQHKGPYALLVKKNTFEKYKMPPGVYPDYDCTREEVLNIACDYFGETPTVSYNTRHPACPQATERSRHIHTHPLRRGVSVNPTPHF